MFEKSGTFKFHFGVPGKEEGQLWFPRKVAVMRTNSKFVVCDRGNERSRMQIFTKNGHYIKKIAIRYIDIVAGLAVTNQGHIVAVDSVSPTVFIISEDGDLVHWFDCSDHMREPSDIAISGKLMQFHRILYLSFHYQQETTSTSATSKDIVSLFSARLVSSNAVLEVKKLLVSRTVSTFRMQETY